MFSTAIGSESVPASGLFALLGDGNFMSEAGVAGDGLPGRVANVGPIFGVPCGPRAGEGLADRGFGRGGGGISDKASGETESFSESVTPAADELEALLLGSVRLACFARGC